MPSIPRRRTVAIIGLLLLVAVLGAFFGGFLTLAPPDYDPKTKILHEKERGLSVHGAWSDPSAPERSQLLDAPSYITSWKDTGQSEGIIIQARICLDFAGSFLKQGHVKLSTSTGGGWAEVKDAVIELPAVTGGSGCQEWTSTIQYFFTGEFNGWFRAEMYAELWDLGPNPLDGDLIHDLIWSGAWIRDDAMLVSGRGTITSPTELQVFAVGQTIPITVDLGSSQSQKVSDEGEVSTDSGYTLELYSEAQGDTVKTWDLPVGPGTFSVDASGARLEYTVTAADWSNVGECRNVVTLKLLNDLFLKDQTDAKTIDLESLKPEPPTIDVTTPGGIWEEGNPITITVNAANRTDALVNIIVEYQETGVRILERNRVAQLEFTTTPPTDGVLVVTVSIEVDCRASDPVEYTVIVKNQEPIDYTKKPGGFVLSIWLILVIIAVLLILAGIFLPFPIWPWKVVVILVALIWLFVGILVFPG